MKCNQEFKVLWDNRVKVCLAKVIFFFLVTNEKSIFFLVDAGNGLFAHFSMLIFFPVKTSK